jgi:hypothetical protein
VTSKFRHLNETARAALEAGEPVISVDGKNENWWAISRLSGGNPSRRAGRWRSAPTISRTRISGTRSVSNDTSAFAVNSIRACWTHLGRARYLDASCLAITADGVASNSSRTRLCKTELQKLANEPAIPIRVCHFPPGTSKWNRIEHRMFSYVSLTLRATPLESLQVIIDLIGSTTTSTGLKVYARLDPGDYGQGIKVTDAELAAVNIVRDDFHPDRNYTINPNTNHRSNYFVTPKRGFHLFPVPDAIGLGDHHAAY